MESLRGSKNSTWRKEERPGVGFGAFVWLGTPSSLPSCFHCLCVFRLELAGGFPGRRLSLRVLAPPPATPSWGGCLAETKHSLRCPAPTSSALSLAAGLPLVAAEPETLGSGAGRQWDQVVEAQHPNSAPFCYLGYFWGGHPRAQTHLSCDPLRLWRNGCAWRCGFELGCCPSLPCGPSYI